MKAIGLFDSGIGGLSILKEINKILPSTEVFYIADEANSPYGSKSVEFVHAQSHQLTQELIHKGAELIVVACNSATVSCIAELRADFPHIPFVGVEPYINVVNHHEGLQKGKPGLILTKRTFESKRFIELKEKFDPTGKIQSVVLFQLASLIEELLYAQEKETIYKKIEEELAPLRAHEFSHLVLGCTHYPLIKNFIEKTLHLECVSPCPYVAKRVASLLNSSQNETVLPFFNFKSTKKQIWEKFSYHSLGLAY